MYITYAYTYVLSEPEGDRYRLAAATLSAQVMNIYYAHVYSIYV